MNNYAMEYDYRETAAEAMPAVRAAFIRRTYGHLAGAILAFVALESVLFTFVPVEAIFARMGNMGVMFGALIAFIAVAFLADYWARQSTSRPLQYAGLALYVVVEAIIFVPLLYVASRFYTGVIAEAGILTLAVFAGLTIAVLVTKKDFSFLRTALILGSFAMLGLFIAAMIFGFNLGLVYCFAGVALACGFILYDTSNVLHHYHTDQHVAASLALFASIAMLFWYILRIVMASRD